MEWKEIIDISLPLSASTIVYPGNPRVEIEEVRGASSTHSKITLGSHTGTHIDAPRHVFPDRGGVEIFPLAQMNGPAIVVDCTSATEKVTRQDLGNALKNKGIATPRQDLGALKGTRILLKTQNSIRGFDTFRDDFIYLDGDCAEWLASEGVALVGIDYLSIKQRGGSDHRPHTALLEKNIVILEGIDLSHVEAGEYTLACLPLSFPGLDGAPARAVLMR
jgi:arylformamidase